mmetsp:Transcript_33845/g.49755  ORF Transcript_33845/g.49755 Transcript_33845/m.49755 type:complete len:253 (+) Transcript_33845:479-1237(+)
MNEQISARVSLVAFLVIIVIVGVVSDFVRFALVLAVLDQRLGDEHPRDAHEGDDEDPDLNVGLQIAIEAVQLCAIVDRTGLKGDVDQSSDERRRSSSRELAANSDPVSAPLQEDHEDHVPEEGKDEDDLRDEFVEEGIPVAEVNLVGSLEEHAQNHVQDTEDDRDLHFQRVSEQNFVGGNLPHRIQTKRVHAVLNECTAVVNPLRGAEVGHAECERVVVDKSIVDSKERHQKEHVASVVDHGDSFVQLGRSQ